MTVGSLLHDDRGWTLSQMASRAVELLNAATGYALRELLNADETGYARGSGDEP